MNNLLTHYPVNWIDGMKLDRRNEAKQQPLYRWQPQGAYRDVKAGDTPYGPPNCLCLFRKENSITPTCETMHFPLG